MPWATDRAAVLQHYVDDVLKIPGVEVRPHCSATCSDMDLLIGGRRVTQVLMQEEADAQPVAWSVSGGVGRYAGEFVPQTGGRPLVVSGLSRRNLPVRIRLLTSSGRELSTATTAAGPTFLESLASPQSGADMVELDTHDQHGIDSLDFFPIELFSQPSVTTHCQGTTIAVQAPRAMAYGYTGSRSFGFTLANVGTSTCRLDGYLRLTVHDSRGTLPFTVKRGSSQFWRDPGPRAVGLEPGQVAVVAVDKYRCDAGLARKGTSFHLVLPGLEAVVLPGSIDYCKPSTDDPGNTLTMTAIAASMSDLYRLPA